MYLDHFGLNEPPFRITPHTDFFFQGANRGATLEALLYAITNGEGIIRVSGEVGSGKTMLCRVLMERLPASVETIYLANPSLSRDEILFAVADELNLNMEGGRTTRVLRALQEHLIRLFGEGRRVVVLIDEAHAMPKETLEEIRLLSNLESNRHKLLQIVLFGQPELDQHLNNADMRQLKERITHGFRLEPLVRSDIDTYIDFRMRAAGYRGPKVFTPRAIRIVADASEGLTRRINILADKALLAAFAGGTHAVTDAEARRAVRDSQFYRAGINSQKVWIGASTLTAGLVLGWALHALYPENNGASAESASVAKGAAVRAAAAPSIGASGLGPVRSVSAAPADLHANSAGTSNVDNTAASPSSSLNRRGPVTPGNGTATTAASGTPAPPAHGELVRARFAATQEWLKAAPGQRYSIQLVTVSANQLAQMEAFLLKATKVIRPEELLVYGVKIDGEQHYRAAYGSYATAADALVAISELPEWVKQQRPYYRTVERMRSQNRR
jgi:type II secretory pathway predicted ATPase ExeA/septal ring-binding cell division protein DamX